MRIAKLDAAWGGRAAPADAGYPQLGRPPLAIAAIQMAARPFEVTENLAVAEARVARAARAGSQLVVLPELFSAGYCYDRRLHDLRESLAGETVSCLLDWARRWRIHVGGTFLESVGRGMVITFALVSPRGELLCYRKRHPAFFENLYVARGREVGILDTALGRVGVAICWDMVQTRLVRELAGRIDLLIISSAWPDITRGSFPLPGRLCRWMTAQVARRPIELAQRLGVPVVHANQCGTFDTRLPRLPFRYVAPFVGGSMIVEPAVGREPTVLAQAELDATIVAATVHGSGRRAAAA